MSDSACSLPAELAGQNGVTVVPMWVSVGGHQYRDGELSLDEVLARAPEGFSTSGPAPGELADAAAAADRGDGVVVMTVSARMSGVYEAARVAAGSLEGKQVAVVDTGTAAGAQGLVVLAASRAARSGAPLAQVVAAARVAAARVTLVATLPSLDYLARGGRVPGAAAWGAKWLGLHPVFEFRDGRARPLRPARGRLSARRRLVAAWASQAARSGNARPSLHVAAMHAREPALAEELLAAVSAQVHPATSFVGSFSPVMVAHTGPGLLGLAWWWEPATP